MVGLPTQRSRQIWYEQWADERGQEAGPISYDEFICGFFDLFFPINLREAKVVEFVNLKQGTMSMREYAFKFSKLSKCAPFMVVDPRARISKFTFGASELVSRECKMAVLVKDIDISCLMMYPKQIEEENLRQKAR